MVFSIIIPIYKVEKYLEQCVNAVLNQTFNDYEIILVDDGSPDGCPEICDRYANSDDRIKVVHKKNGGLSDARNAGIDVASGEYVIFLDSDDYWDDEEALSKIKKLIDDNRSDIVSWRRKKYYEGSCKIETVGYDVEYLGAKDAKKLFKSRNLDTSAWSKAIKKSLFEKYDLKFEKGVLSEDVEWCARLLSAVDIITVSNLDFYVYRKREGSITNQITEKNVHDLKKHIDKIIMLTDNASEDKKTLLRHFLAEQYCNCVITISGCEGASKEKEWIKRHKKLLKYSVSNRGKILRVMLNVLGVRWTLKLIDKIR